MGKKLEDLFDRVREALKLESRESYEEAKERLYGGQKRRESGIRESVRELEVAPPKQGEPMINLKDLEDANGLG